MQDFKKLTVWQKSHALMIDIHAATEKFPKEEQFSMTKQIREASRSVPFNIAEGAGKGDSEFLRFLKIAMGSSYETEAQLIACRDLKFLPGPVFERLNTQCQEVRRMLDALIRRVASSLKPRKLRRRTNG